MNEPVRSPRRRLLITALALALLPPAPAAAREARFVFTGTVTRPGGQPIRGARLELEGAGVAAQTDAQGRYALTHVVPDLEAAAGAGLRLVLRARSRGWNLGLPSGETSLALELRRLPAADGGARIEVRSNDAAAAKAAALALGAGGDAVVALDCPFLRLLGREDRSAPVLAAVEVVTPAAPAPAVPFGSRGAGVVPAAPPARPAPVVTSPPERPESLRLFPSAPDPGAAPATGAGAPVPRPGPAVASSDSGAAGVPAAAAAPAPSPAPKAGPAIAPDPVPAPIARDTLPRSARAPWPAGTATSPVPLADTTSRPGIRVLVRPDTAAPAADSGAAAPARGAGRAPRSPLSVALGRALADSGAGAARPAARSGCGCRVSGTVELRAEQVPRGGLRVVVSLADLPAIRDTAVFFMGPPRAFDLGVVPCGTHRLDVRALSTRRYARVLPVATTFECAAGGAREIRVALEPR